MDEQLGAWWAHIADDFGALRTGLQAETVDWPAVAQTGRALLEAIGRAGPGPAGLEDRVAGVIMAVACLTVDARAMDRAVSVEERLLLARGLQARVDGLVASLAWLRAPVA